MLSRLSELLKSCAALAALAVAVAGASMSGGFGSGPILGVTAAIADDDDDDFEYDDDDDEDFERDDDNDDDRPPVRPRRTPQRAQAPTPPPEPLPDRAENEIIAAGLTFPQLDQLTAAGFTILEQQDVATPGDAIVKLQIPAGSTLEAARDQVQAVSAQSAVDFNHYYRPGQARDCSGNHCLAPQLIGWPASGPRLASCTDGVRIGLIDTGINPEHQAFDGRSIEILDFAPGANLADSGKQHGTAVAALLVGSADSRTPGLLPGAELVAIDPFHRAGRQDDRADAYSLVRAIDRLAQSDIAVLNMSLSGPANAILEKAVEAVTDRDIVMVAAVGNHGPTADPVFPAAYPAVIAVTAVDGGKQVYRRAVRGDHVDLAAPGVNVWAAASISGGRPQTGTSFATPFVTAAAALLKAANPAMSAAEIERRLGEAAEDLGDPGRDAVFGWGLVQAGGLCSPAQ
jgi:subtilisin family serine protease